MYTVLDLYVIIAFRFQLHLVVIFVFKNKVQAEHSQRKYLWSNLRQILRIS